MKTVGAILKTGDMHVKCSLYLSCKVMYICRALCRECNAKEKARGLGKYVCHKCHSVIEEGHIKFKGEAFHPYHFNCNSCG